tara:strand:- start:470 stop:580 length:111 start_codon:yes stop_codon:yes gene_type:complete
VVLAELVQTHLGQEALILQSLDQTSQLLEVKVVVVV